MKLDGKVVLITGVVRESAPPAPDTWQAREQPSPSQVCPRTGFPRWLQHCRALATRLWHEPTDIRHEEQIQTAVTATVEAFGRLDIEE